MLIHIYLALCQLFVRSASQLGTWYKQFINLCRDNQNAWNLSINIKNHSSPGKWRLFIKWHVPDELDTELECFAESSETKKQWKYQIILSYTRPTSSCVALCGLSKFCLWHQPGSYMKKVRQLEGLSPLFSFCPKSDGLKFSLQTTNCSEIYHITLKSIGFLYRFHCRFLYRFHYRFIADFTVDFTTDFTAEFTQILLQISL